MRSSASSREELQQVKDLLQPLLHEDLVGTEEWTNAGTFLATLLLQEDDDEEEKDENNNNSNNNNNNNNNKKNDNKGLLLAGRLLHERGFDYRLSRQALIQSHDHPVASPPLEYANAWENVLPEPLLEKLSQVFSQKSSFWSSHNYSDGSSQGKPPSPYFSYIVPLFKKKKNNDNNNRSNNNNNNNNKMKTKKTAKTKTTETSVPDTVLHKIISILQQHAATLFPKVLECTAAEWWCHCRPHASGHQLHFDSDDEGRGGVRNPVCSCVLFLTGGEDDNGEDSSTNNNSTTTTTTRNNHKNIGGETLLTTQTATSMSLCDEQGWLCEGRRNRLLAFRGNLLHGVVPGGGCDASHKDGRRITFMVAFWNKIRVQDDPGPGSARPFARVEREEWAQPLLLLRQPSSSLPSPSLFLSTNTTTSSNTTTAAATNNHEQQQQQQQSNNNNNNKKKKNAVVEPAQNCFFQVPVWEDVDQQENERQRISLRQVRKSRVLPPYDAFFQFYT